jgi:hypothetical protein
LKSLQARHAAARRLLDVNIPVLVITGPVGVGKSTTGHAVSECLDERGVAHALIDMDLLRWCHPSPAGDPFHVRLGLRNLAAVWSQNQAAGASQLILVDVVEKREAVAEYRAAIPGALVQVVRLRAPLATIRQRLEGRETGSSLPWYLHRAAELDELMDVERVGDIQVDSEGKTVEQVAREVLARAAAAW